MAKNEISVETTVPILVVEDESDYTVLIKDALSGAGFPCSLQAVESGEEAIAYLSRQGKYADDEKYPFPSLLLLDLKMPGVGGFGVLRWLATQPDVRRKLNVVILSGSQSTKEIEVVFELGAHLFWPKSDCLTLASRIRCLQRLWTCPELRAT